MLKESKPDIPPEFVETAKGILKAEKGTPEANLGLANLGDPDAFDQTIDDYEKALTVKPASAIEEYQQKSRKAFIDTIIYSGSGDKNEALKDHHQDATYKDGLWTLPST